MRRPYARRLMACVASVLVAGCGATEPRDEPIALDPVANLGSQMTTLAAGATSADYIAVIANTRLDGTTTAGFALRGDLLAAPDPVVAGLAPSLVAPTDVGAAFEGRVREAEREALTGRIPAAQAWFAARSAPASSAARTPGGRSDQAIPADARVGDLLRINVQGDSACGSAVYHAARVMALSQRAIVLADTLNPRNGFGTADYARIAARFDTVVFPLDSAAFGAPTDLDRNGRIALVFTRVVNEATPRGASSYLGGFTFSRDLFPIVGTSRTDACAGSNEGEYFYLLAPDPLGSINGNPRTVSFVDSISTSVIAHEFQHLINAGRRLYVNGALRFEQKWLDEGLSHLAEELLFYREAGLGARANIGLAALGAGNRQLFAFNRDMSGNQGRYRAYLDASARSSPVAPNDELPTRGAAWSLLRYLLDRAGPSDADRVYRLVNSRLVGVDNLASVFGPAVPSLVRDWNVSHAADDLVTTPEFLQPSWNWHSIYPGIAAFTPYPLRVQGMSSGTTYNGTVLSGGAAYFRLTVPANSSATLSLVEQAGGAPTLSLVTVRTR